MNDPLSMSRVQGIGNLPRTLQGITDGERTARDSRRQRLTVRQLHYDCVQSVGLLETVNSRDVGVVQGGEDASFALEPREPIRIGRERGRQELDRDVTAKPRVAGAIDLAHPAGADQRLQ